MSVNMSLGTFTLTVLGETMIIEITDPELQLNYVLPGDIVRKLFCNELVAMSRNRNVEPFYIPSDGEHIRVIDDEDKIRARKEWLSSLRTVVNKYGEDLSVTEAKKLQEALSAKGVKLWDLHLGEALKMVDENDS